MNISWSDWQKMPEPESCREIKGPEGPGVYQIRDSVSGEFILFGESKTCRKRMKSFYPKPYGTGTRNNESKRMYVLTHYRNLEYRTAAVQTKEEAVKIDRYLKTQNNHKFNT